MLRQKARDVPCGDELKGSHVLHGCACAAGSHEPLHGGGYSAEKSAYSRQISKLLRGSHSKWVTSNGKHRRRSNQKRLPKRSQRAPTNGRRIGALTLRAPTPFGQTLLLPVLARSYYNKLPIRAQRIPDENKTGYYLDNSRKTNVTTRRYSFGFPRVMQCHRCPQSVDNSVEYRITVQCSTQHPG